MKNRTVTFLLAVALLAGVAFAGQNWQLMYFRNGATTMEIAGTAACTTKWVSCSGWRFQALYWRQWVSPGASDSGQVKWDVQAVVTDTLFPDSEADSIRSLQLSQKSSGSSQLTSWPTTCQPCACGSQHWSISDCTHEAQRMPPSFVTWNTG